MKIVIDPPKQAANLEKHKLDLAVITEAFFEDARVESAKTGRFKAIGRVDEMPVALIFKPLGSEAISLISLRPASRRERRIL